MTPAMQTILASMARKGAQYQYHGNIRRTGLVPYVARHPATTRKERMSADAPHYIDGKPATTSEIIPVIMQHINHAGIAFFPNCPQCQKETK